MSDHSPIPIPLAQRWKWIRFQVLPLAFFALCAITTAILWSRQAGTTNALGEAFGERVELTSTLDGRLMKLPREHQLQVFSTVKAGEVVAMLDDAPIKAEIRALEEQVKLMESEVGETEEKYRLEQSDRLLKTEVETREIAESVGKARTEVIRIKSLIAADKGESEALAAAYNALRSAPVNTVLKQDLYKAKGAYDMVRERLAENVEGLKEAQQEVQLCLERQKAHRTEPATGDLDKLIEPKRAAIEVQKALLAQAQEKLINAKIKSPIDGVVAALFCQPEQDVRRGMPLMTIASDRAKFIVSYVRQGRTLNVGEDMPVEIKLRTNPAQTVESKVVKVGAQIEAVPPHQLRNAKVLEWGIPVQISIPDADKMPQGIILQPGELVEIHLKANTKARPTSVLRTAMNGSG